MPRVVTPDAGDVGDTEGLRPDRVSGQKDIPEEALVRMARILADELRAPSRLPRYLSSTEAASVASVTTRTIRAWVKRGDLRDYWAGNDLRIDLEDLLAYLSRKRPDDVTDIRSRAEAIMDNRG